MPAVVARTDGAGWWVEGSWPDAAVANRFLAHLVARVFAPATVRACAYDLVNFGRFRSPVPHSRQASGPATCRCRCLRQPS
jgi:hypothetical protein